MQVFTARPVPDLHEKLVIWKSGGLLQALDLGGYESRNASVLRVNTGDPRWRSLAFSRADGFLDEPVPDFLLDGWPQVGLDDYDDACVEAAAAGAQPPERRVVGWIGNCDTHPSRWALHGMAQDAPDALEVIDVTWTPVAGSARLATQAGNQLSLAEQIRRWAALIDVEGNGWSARLKLLLHSGRPVLVADRPWKEWFWPELVPMEHVIPVRRDLADVVERARWVRDHPEEAARIGAAGQAFARERLTRAAASDRWAEVLRGVAAEPPRAFAPEHLRAVLEPAVRALTPAR
jgi:hypothetical protein